MLQNLESKFELPIFYFLGSTNVEHISVFVLEKSDVFLCCRQPTVPSWEKDFCRVVGALDWETLLQMKKCMHFYDNVINWNDSAGEEAFCNAKRRYWAEINGFPCDIPFPDPDLYIEKINWDSKTNPELLPDSESVPVTPGSDHEPVVIFGDSFVQNQGFTVTGWGDDEETFEVPANQDDANYGDSWGQNWEWGNSCNNMAASGWPDCNNNNNTWQYSDGSGHGYMSWEGGWNNDWGWSYADNNFNYVGPVVEEQGMWNESNVRTTADAGRSYVSGYGSSRVQANEHCMNNMSRTDRGRHKGPYRGNKDKRATSREWKSINSCGGPVGQRAAIRDGQAWNREKRVS
ncbi:hypothetical protein DH2020_038968 [Rehmannia glutinosa]|uniref:Uncharacterized protein n=1 Tax=Rehmannia glutinosa TaxID=99300 RepID=A0ABR0UZC1_REHGL